MVSDEVIKIVITSAITGGVTLGGAFWSFKGKKSETDANVSKAYIDGNNLLFNNMQSELNRVIGKVAVLEEQMKKMQEEYEAKIEKLENENDDLRNKLRDSIGEVKYLKEKLNEN